jgi:hypothetical protein
LAQAVDTAIQEAGALNLGIGYQHEAPGQDNFSVNTNIGDLILGALKKAAGQYARRAMEELEKALRARAASYIEGKFLSKEELDLFFQMAKGDKAAMDQLKNTLTNKMNEFERRIKSAAEEAADQAKEEVRAQAEQAAKDLLQGKTPSPEKPSLPALPSIPGLPRR